MKPNAFFEDTESDGIRYLWDCLIAVYAAVTGAASIIATTIITMAIAVSIYLTYWPQLFAWAAFTTGSIYLVLMCLKILRNVREQEGFTLTDVGDRLVDLDHEVIERLDVLMRNDIGCPAYQEEERLGRLAAATVAHDEQRDVSAEAVTP